jgi:uncharacterized membrane protein
MTIGRRLFPRQFDNRYHGHKVALWLLGLFVALKLVVSLNSILNTASVAAGADGFPLESYGGDGARAVLMLFALDAVGNLMLALIGLAALVRYRAMVPFIYLLAVLEQIVRRSVIGSYAIERSGQPGAVSYVIYAVLALLVLGMILSLLGRAPEDAARANEASL